MPLRDGTPLAVTLEDGTTPTIESAASQLYGRHPAGAQNDGAMFERRLARWQNGEPKQAAQDFSQAIQVNPKNDNAYNGLAWAQSTAPRTPPLICASCAWRPTRAKPR
jgi:hypothetical protein